MLWPSHVTATVVACDLPCTSASVIFHTSSHSDFTLCFFDLSIKVLSLGSCCLLSVALQTSHCHLVSTSLPAVGTALLPAVGTALSSRILGFRPWLFFCPSRPSDPPGAVGLLFLAPSTHCRLLLLCRFLVSARACLSRSFVSSRMTATFCSSSSLSRHFRVRLLVWSVLQLHLVVVYSVVACGWSLQHCCVVLCYGVVAGPAPVR